MIAFALTTYMCIEYTNYNKYKNKYKLFNEFKNTDQYEKSILNKKIDVIHDDVKKSNTEFKNFIQEMFKNFTQIEKIPKLNVVRSLMDNLCLFIMCDDVHEKIKLLTTDLEKHIGIKFAEIDNQPINQPNNQQSNKQHSIKYLSISNGRLKSWYKPIFIQNTLIFIRFISSLHMMYMGFKKYILDDGVIIWSKTKLSKECLFFAPSCIGGITFYQPFLKKLSNEFVDKNICILEIPGMAWTSYSSDYPPSISKVSSIISKFFVDKKFEKINMFGHSFGTIVLNHIVNEQYNYLKNNKVAIDKIIYVEGLLFYVSVFKTLLAIEMPLLNVLLGKDKIDILTMPLFQRDLYVKFYIKRYLSLSNSVLCGDTTCEAECNFYAIMARDDNKFITKDYVDYINKKNINIKYTIFDNCGHGSFVWENNMQKYLINILAN